MRTFIALELPPTFEDDVAAMARVLRPVVSGRFMARETYHLTLAFLGDIGEAQARDAIEALDAACVAQPPVALRAEGLGHFGRATDCTLWLGLAPDPQLMSLARRTHEELAHRGLPFDDKPFRPHITLARRARLPKGTLPQLAFPENAHASVVTLFKSTLSQDGASYKPLYSIELGNV